MDDPTPLPSLFHPALADPPRRWSFIEWHVDTQTRQPQWRTTSGTATKQRATTGHAIGRPGNSHCLCKGVYWRPSCPRHGCLIVPVPEGLVPPPLPLPSPRSCHPPQPPRVGPSTVRPYIHMDGSPRLRLVGHNQANPPRDRHRWWRPSSPPRGCHCRVLAQPHAPHPSRGVGGVGGDGGCGGAWGARPPSRPPPIRLTPTGRRRRWPSAGTTQRRSDRQPSPPPPPPPPPFSLLYRVRGPCRCPDGTVAARGGESGAFAT